MLVWEWEIAPAKHRQTLQWYSEEKKKILLYRWRFRFRKQAFYEICFSVIAAIYRSRSGNIKISQYKNINMVLWEKEVQYLILSRNPEYLPDPNYCRHFKYSWNTTVPRKQNYYAEISQKVTKKFQFTETSAQTWTIRMSTAPLLNPIQNADDFCNVILGSTLPDMSDHWWHPPLSPLPLNNPSPRKHNQVKRLNRGSKEDNLGVEERIHIHILGSLALARGYVKCQDPNDDDDDDDKRKRVLKHTAYNELSDTFSFLLQDNNEACN